MLRSGSRLEKPHVLSAGVPLAFVAYMAFALSDASVRLIAGRVDPFEIAFSGAALGLILLPLARTPGEQLVDIFRGSSLLPWLIRAVGSAIASVGGVIAFMRLSMPEAFALIFLMPLFVTIISVFVLRETAGSWQWAAVALGFVGMLLVLRPGGRAFDIGDAAALLSAFASAIVIVLFRAGGIVEKRISMLGSGLIGSTLINGVLMLPHLTCPSPRDMMLLAGFGLLAMFGQSLLMLASREVEVRRIAPPEYSQMIWAVLLSFLLFHQSVDDMSFIGIAVIIIAGLLIWMSEQVRLPSWRRRFALRPR